jgi:hypothetical protein
MSGKLLVYQAYLLRLWRDDAGAPWRATLIAAERPDEQLHFATLDALCAFLLAQAAPATLLTQAQANQSAQSDRDQRTPDGAE